MNGSFFEPTRRVEMFIEMPVEKERYDPSRISPYFIVFYKHVMPLASIGLYFVLFFCYSIINRPFPGPINNQKYQQHRHRKVSAGVVCHRPKTFI